MQMAGCSDRLARLVWIEVAEQALHYQNTGKFVEDQIAFTLALAKREEPTHEV